MIQSSALAAGLPGPESTSHRVAVLWSLVALAAVTVPSLARWPSERETRKEKETRSLRLTLRETERDSERESLREREREREPERERHS